MKESTTKMTTEEIQTTIEEYTKKHNYHPDNRGRENLIPLLQEFQEKFGYISEESVLAISKHLDLPPSKIYGVATFYNQFRFRPLGKYVIQICRGTACHVAGSITILDALKKELKIESGETTKDGLFTLQEVACIGACGLAPVIAINGEFFAKITPEKISEILNNFRKENSK